MRQHSSSSAWAHISYSKRQHSEAGQQNSIPSTYAAYQGGSCTRYRVYHQLLLSGNGDGSHLCIQAAEFELPPPLTCQATELLSEVLCFCDKLHLSGRDVVISLHA